MQVIGRRAASYCPPVGAVKADRTPDRCRPALRAHVETARTAAHVGGHSSSPQALRRERPLESDRRRPHPALSRDQRTPRPPSCRAREPPAHHHRPALGHRRARSPSRTSRTARDYVVVASNGGADRHPAWWLNLEAVPEATVQVGADVIPIVAHAADPAERERLWPTAHRSQSLLCALRAAYRARHPGRHPASASARITNPRRIACRSPRSPHPASCRRRPGAALDARRRTRPRLRPSIRSARRLQRRVHLRRHQVRARHERPSGRQGAARPGDPDPRPAGPALRDRRRIFLISPPCGRHAPRADPPMGRGARRSPCSS